VAQLVNTIHSLFLAREDRFIATPNFHVFAMYAAHQGGQSVRTVLSSPSIAMPRAARAQTLWGLAGSASRRDRELVVTIVNPHATDPRPCAISVHGGSVRSARATVLTSTDLRAHNSFDQPNARVPREATVNVAAGSIHHTVPAASGTRLDVELG